MNFAARNLSSLASPLCIVLTVLGGCVLTSDLDGLASGVGNGSPGGGGGGATGAGGEGGQDAVAVCDQVEDCVPTGTECNVPSCEEGICVYTIAPEFQPIESQAVGDCRSVVCDALGGERTVNIDDPFDDLNDCTNDSCVNGEVNHAAQLGASCGGSLVCTDNGACAECNVAQDCELGKPLCQSNTCVPVTCQNNTQDVLETDVDCGGADCAPCTVDQGCLMGSDCDTSSCDANLLLCLKATCDDKIRNGSETDLDCGGSQGCPPCKAGLGCNGGVDCSSGVCVATGGVLQCAAPNCGDGVRNGSESDVDCGGPCNGCAGGKACTKATDCVSGLCKSNVCCTPEPVADTCAGKCGTQQNKCGKSVDCGPCDTVIAQGKQTP